MPKNVNDNSEICIESDYDEFLDDWCKSILSSPTPPPFTPSITNITPTVIRNDSENYRGVIKYKNGRSFYAYVTEKRATKIHLGSFPSAIEAAAAHDYAQSKIDGKIKGGNFTDKDLNELLNKHTYIVEKVDKKILKTGDKPRKKLKI